MTSQSTDRSLCETAARRPCVVVGCNDNSAPIDNVSECKVSGCNIVPSLTHAGLSLSLSLSLSLWVCVCVCVCQNALLPHFAARKARGLELWRHSADWRPSNMNTSPTDRNKKQCASLCNVFRKNESLDFPVSSVNVFRSSRLLTEIFLRYPLIQRHSIGSPFLNYVRTLPW